MIKIRKKEFTLEELKIIFLESISYRDIALRLGYNLDSGSNNISIKKLIQKYNIDISHFKGQGHLKTKGRVLTRTEDYINNTVKVTTHKLRLRLIRDGYFEEKCCRCGNSEWLNKPIPLELHHKDGNKDNNILENLELLCPNCHYFTDTYKSKNVGR